MTNYKIYRDRTDSAGIPGVETSQNVSLWYLK